MRLLRVDPPPPTTPSPDQPLLWGSPQLNAAKAQLAQKNAAIDRLAREQAKVVLWCAVWHGTVS